MNEGIDEDISDTSSIEMTSVALDIEESTEIAIETDKENIVLLPQSPTSTDAHKRYSRGGDVLAFFRSIYDRIDKFKRRHSTILNVICFWFFGLVNNSVYVVMLSAAVDMLEDVPGVPTSAVLIADILPTLLIKIAAPFFMDRLGRYIYRIAFNVVLAVLAFLFVGWSPWIPLKLFGVVLGSISAGFGEITFLAYSSYYRKSTVAGWSSGTGMAGLFGALSYMIMSSWLVLELWLTLTILSGFPLCILFFYFLILVSPHKSDNAPIEEKETPVEQDDTTESHSSKHLSLKMRFLLLLPLIRFLIPLFVVYFSEYTINQGIVPTIYFKGNWMSKRDHYVYYQTLYQTGVLLSRSSVMLFRVNQVWVFSTLQVLNMIIVFIHALTPYMGSVFVLFVIVFWEGLLGGATYVNAFHHISSDIDPKYKEYSLGVTSVSDSFGITCAGVFSLFLEPFIIKWQRDHGVYNY